MCARGMPCVLHMALGVFCVTVTASRSRGSTVKRTFSPLSSCAVALTILLTVVTLTTDRAEDPTATPESRECAARNGDETREGSSFEGPEFSTACAGADTRREAMRFTTQCRLQPAIRLRLLKLSTTASPRIFVLFGGLGSVHVSFELCYLTRHLLPDRRERENFLNRCLCLHGLLPLRLCILCRWVAA